MYLLNNLKFNHSVQHVIDDIQYPAGWFNDPLERAKIGIIEVPDPIKPDDSLFTYVENPDGSYTTTPRTADDVAAYKAAKDAEQAKSVRAIRDTKLSKTDWRFRSDMTPSQAWKDYCQALRDVPAQAGFPWTIVWPDAP